MRSLLVRIAMTLIAINAALAIVILLGGNMGDTGGRILGTSLLATGTTFVVMMQMPALADRRLGWLPLAAVCGAGVGFVIVTAAIWGGFDSDVAWKTAGTGYTLAVGGAVASLLAGLRIQGPSSWIGAATLAAIGVAAAMIVVALWFEVGSEGYWRLFAVVAVLVAAGALAIPILHRSSQDTTPDEPITRCPYCGADLGSLPGADVTCPSCGRRFEVRRKT